MTPEESKQVLTLIWQCRVIWHDQDSTMTDTIRELKFMRSAMSGKAAANAEIIDKILQQ